MIKEKTPGHVEFFKYPFNQQKSRKSWFFLLIEHKRHHQH